MQALFERRALATIALGAALSFAVGANPSPANAGTPPQLSQQVPGSFPPTTTGRKSPLDNTTEEDPFKDKVDSQRSKMIVSERRKKMVADTDKLLLLANELKVEVDKATKDEMSLTVIKKAADIEKLAHDVKERMKG